MNNLIKIKDFRIRRAIENFDKLKEDLVAYIDKLQSMYGDSNDD